MRVVAIPPIEGDIMIRTSNRDAHKHVGVMAEFEGSNLYARRKGNLYIVCSWRDNFPIYMYCYTSGKWIGNSSKFSRSTSKHQIQARPSVVDVWVTLGDALRILYAGGYVDFLGNIVKGVEQ